MTYCVGIKLNQGLVMLSDTRTNAGVDYISKYKKMFTWEASGDRAIVIMSAGNLSITQGVIKHLNQAIQRANGGENIETLFTAMSMYRIAELVSDAIKMQQDRYRSVLLSQGIDADASLLLGGQRNGGKPRLFMFYSATNFIEATEDTNFFQIGEHKYGKPVLDRMITVNSDLSQGLNAAYVSMDSTLRSNLSVGMPLDLAIIKTGEYRFFQQRRIEQDDTEFANISKSWADALSNGFSGLPSLVP